MILLFIIIVVQLLIAGVIIVVLKGLLHRELEKAAIEKLMSLRIEDHQHVINVYFAGRLPLDVQHQLTMMAKNKFNDSPIIFEHNKMLKGGLIITIADQVLDFSLSSRLEHLWS